MVASRSVGVGPDCSDLYKGAPGPRADNFLRKLTNIFSSDNVDGTLAVAGLLTKLSTGA